MSTISLKQFFRNVFYIMLTLTATPYMLLSTFLSLFMEVPIVSLSMEVYLPGYDLMPKYEDEHQQNEDEQDDEDDDDDENVEDDEDENDDENVEDESVKIVHTTPVLAPINSDNHHDDLNTDHLCTPIPRHNSEICPESPLKRRPTDIEDEIVIDSTPRILAEDFKTIGEVAATTVDLPTIDEAESPATPPPSVDSEDLKQEPSESSSSVENDE